MPVGTVIYYAGINLPSEEWKWTNGESLNKQDYPELFNAIGYIYGGNGNQFNLPDTRDEFIRSTGSTNTLGSKSKDTMKKVGFVIHGIDVGGFEGAWMPPASEGDCKNYIYNNRPDLNGGSFVEVTERINGGLVPPKEINQARMAWATDRDNNLTPGVNYNSVHDFKAEIFIGSNSETKPRNIVMNVIIKVK